MTSVTALIASQFSPQEVALFRHEGYVVARGLCGPQWRDRMEAVTQDHLQRRIEPLEFEADLRYPGAPCSLKDVGGETVRRLKQAHSRDYVFTQWITHPLVTERLRQLLGPEIVCPLAHHNCIMTKEPRFSSDTGWHQDIRYWSFARPDLVNVWVALGPERRENGCLKVIPGSHMMSFDREQFDPELFFRPDHPLNQPLIASELHVELEPGDVLFFHALTLHAATRNYSARSKHSVVFTFRAADNLPIPGTRSAASPELLIH